MPEKRLRQLVDSLHEELAGTESVPEQDRERLRELTGDIETLLGEDEAASRQRASAIGPLEEAAARFESEHPRLAMVLGELVDTLAKLGI